MSVFNSCESKLFLTFLKLTGKVVSIPSYLTGSSPQSYPIVKFSSLITGQTYDAYQALMEKVRNKIPATLVEEVNPKDAHAVLVFCPITSRVGSDVESAMAKPEGSENPCFCLVTTGVVSPFILEIFYKKS